MFTGIIEEVGVVKKIDRKPGMARLTVEANTVVEDIKVGDSVACNGVCLTVVELNHHSISFDIMSQTLERTNLGKGKVGEKINLERSLRAGDRLSGHILSGHIDGMGTLVMKWFDGGNLVLRIATSVDIMRYLVPEGAIACDGISLTIVDLAKDYFTVHIIPHTLTMTNLRFKQIGAMLNLEVDLIGKYVYKYLAQNVKSPKINKEFLAEHGFMG